MIALALSLSFAMQPVDLAELRAQRITGQLAPAQLRDNLVTAARAYAEAGELDAAERELAIALRVDPDLVLDAGVLLLSPILDKAKSAVPDGGGLRFSVSVKDRELIVALDVDDLALVQGVEIELNDTLSKRPLDQDKATARVPLGDAAEVGVYLVDAYGNVLVGQRRDLTVATEPVEETLKDAPVVPIATASPSAMTTTGGVLALTGLTVLAVSAGTAATLAQDPESDFLPPLLLGVGLVGAAAGAVGVGLVAWGGDS